MAWVIATDAAGERRRWPLRMGREIADATAPIPLTPSAAATSALAGAIPASVGTAETPRPQAVFSWKEFGPDGKPVEARLYYVKLPLDRPRTIVRLTVRPVRVAAAEQPIFRLYGLGAGQPDWRVNCVDWFDRERFSEVYHDAEVRIYRNERALPRAYLVPLAVRLPAGQHLKAMAEQEFDPERMLYLDPRATAGGAAGGAAGGGPAPDDLEAPSEAPAVGSWLASTTQAPSSDDGSGYGDDGDDSGTRRPACAPRTERDGWPAPPPAGPSSGSTGPTGWRWRSKRTHPPGCSWRTRSIRDGGPPWTATGAPSGWPTPCFVRSPCRRVATSSPSTTRPLHWPGVPPPVW